MMATEYTPNYNLDLYASADKPNLRDQYNAAMGKIDTQMKKSADDVTNANANVLTLQTQVTEAQKDISALESTVETHGTQITDVQKTADDALSLAKTNESDIAGTQADVTQLNGKVTTVEEKADANASDIQELTETVTNKAPTNHASTSNTYGGGNTSNYGHVRVVDSGSGAASSSVAASANYANGLSSRIAALEASPVQVDISASGFNTKMCYDVASDMVTIRTYSTSPLNINGTVKVGTVPAAQRPTVKIQTLANAGTWGSLYLEVDTDGEVSLRSTAEVGVDSVVSYIIAYFDINGV